jgi:DNA-binding NarL/FixJ family response regulator
VTDPPAGVRGSEPVTVLIVDDHPMVRKIVRWACDARPNLEVVGEATDGHEALEMAAKLCPDIVVLDLLLPKMDGFEVARRLREGERCPRILVLTGSDDSHALFDSMRVQVDGFLDKSGALEDIGELIEEVAGGRYGITSEQEQIAISHLGDLIRSTRESSRIGALLTQRELQVVQLICEALTTHQMARRLGLSERTVESHISNLYKKLKARNRVEAIARAQKLGLVPVS